MSKTTTVLALVLCHGRPGAFQSNAPAMGTPLDGSDDVPEYQILRRLQSGRLLLRRMFVEVDVSELDQPLKRERYAGLVLAPDLEG